ncbi:unnamed protein product [Microthlaspi erraticum]|uniref:Uncharacterized protein n=1 Tax=Microthlaspi erraticum TaxID=1685480 RepID=A0A6D2IA86_9BRAS|nr:unnamed protein product [Microthlaspi erraticum]
MRVLSWNCQGLGNPFTISHLRELWGKFKPEFLFLSETKQGFGFVQQFQFHFGYDRVFTVEPTGASGGLALFYNNSYDVNIVCSNKRIIDIEARHEGNVIFMSFAYGDPVVKLRDLVWERITRIGTTRTELWFLIGDFNEITGNHEKQGGALRQASSFVPFNLMISDCGFVDFPSRGNTLSWRGRRKGRIVRCMLDRALATEEWHDLFPVSHVQYLPMIGSDHRPILATLDSKVTKRRKQFRFDKRWIGLEGLMDSIERGWNYTRGEVSPGLVDRIGNCRHEVSVWRTEKQPYGKQKIEELQRALEEVQNDDNSTQEELIDITNKLKEAYRDEEEYWKQKSRNLWLKDGDLNTKFFHASTKQRRAANRIVGLHNDDNVWVAGEKEVEKVAVGYFDKLFTSTLPTDFTGVLAHMPHRITAQENELLTRRATEMEVHAALFMMHPEKAPGPDGMTVLFFQRSWHIVKNDILKMVNNFLTSGTFDERLNMTHICLIPKTGRPNRMTELRPISLCNVGYKIISKVLCQRLKGILPRLISETQSAFVPGRLISDNILIAQEMFHGLRTNKSCKGKFMAVKTDMSKAYDRVE